MGQMIPHILGDRICASAKFEDQCSQMQRGNTDVNCVRVQDSIDCAQRIRNGTAEFGVFSAESAFHLATLRWDGLITLKELRHRDRLARKCHRFRRPFAAVLSQNESMMGGAEAIVRIWYE